MVVIRQKYRTDPNLKNAIKVAGKKGLISGYFGFSIIITMET